MFKAKKKKKTTTSHSLFELQITVIVSVVVQTSSVQGLVQKTSPTRQALPAPTFSLSLSLSIVLAVTRPSPISVLSFWGEPDSPGPHLWAHGPASWGARSFKQRWPGEPPLNTGSGRIIIIITIIIIFFYNYLRCCGQSRAVTTFTFWRQIFVPVTKPQFIPLITQNRRTHMPADCPFNSGPCQLNAA